VTDTDRNALDQRFETHRKHLRAVALRMLGSSHEADDAVQEAWLRLIRAGDEAVENLGGWLTTVVARVCLDRLRARATKREVPPHAAPELPSATSPEDEALLADSVGLALLVVLDTLAPAERLGFVLHDIFGVLFEEIAPIVGRSPFAAGS
jgi:RNA polymerase sigma-70 factor (ECF subfamily)